MEKLFDLNNLPKSVNLLDLLGFFRAQIGRGADEFYFFNDSKTAYLIAFANPEHPTEEHLPEFNLPEGFCEVSRIHLGLGEAVLGELEYLFAVDVRKEAPFTTRGVLATGYQHIPAVFSRLEVPEGGAYHIRLETKDEYKTLGDRFRSWKSERERRLFGSLIPD